MRKWKQKQLMVLLGLIATMFIVSLLNSFTIELLGGLFRIIGIMLIFFIALGGSKRCKNKGFLFIGVSLFFSGLLMIIYHLDMTNHGFENVIVYESLMFYDLAKLIEIVVFVLGFTIYFKTELLRVKQVFLTELVIFIGLLFVFFGLDIYLIFDDSDALQVFSLVVNILFMAGYLSIIVILFIRRKMCEYGYLRLVTVFVLFFLGQGVLLIPYFSPILVSLRWFLEVGGILYLGYIMYDMAYVKVISTNEEFIEEAKERIENLARIDDLTYIANRKYLFESMDKSFRLSKREKEPIAFLMIDIDDFKMYNDKFGTTHGDSILRRIAMGIEKSCLRPLDFVGRYGGEEFLVFLPYTDFDGTMEVCKRIMKNVHDMRITHYQKENDFLTISIGFSVIIPKEDTKVDVPIKVANEYMLKVKNTGKNDIMGIDLNKGEIEE